MSSSLTAVTTANFQSEVINASATQPVLVDFWAPWCGPCRALGPVLEQLAEEHAGEIKVVKVNTDENQDLAQQFQIRSIPAVKLFCGGRVIDEFIGALPLSQVREFLDPHLPRARPPNTTRHAISPRRATYGRHRQAARAGGAGPGKPRRTPRPGALSSRCQATSIGASQVLGQLPPQAQNDPASNAVRALIHFAALATEEAARTDSLRAGAARSILGGSPDAAVETLLTRMQGDRASRPAPDAKTCCRPSPSCRPTMSASRAGVGAWPPS